MAVLDIRILTGCLLGAVVLSDIERDVELHVVLGRMLALGSDAVHVVATHGEGVENELI